MLTGLALHAGLPDAWPDDGVTAARGVTASQARWRTLGLPAFAQFDNHTGFQGPHQFPDVIGRVPRLCLQLGLTPVFPPLNDPSFQAALETFNGRWQVKGWHRFHHPSLPALQARSAADIAAARERGAARATEAPPRQPFPRRWEFDSAVPPCGPVIFLRCMNGQGEHAARAPVLRGLVLAPPSGPSGGDAVRRADPLLGPSPA